MSKFDPESLRQHLPAYVYDGGVVRRQGALLQAALPGFELLYSIKANPFEPVVRALTAQGFGADAASAREVEIATACGGSAERIYYSAPGKSAQEIWRSLGKCTLIADSLSELERIEAAAAQAGRVELIGLRVHPQLDLDGKAAGPNQFGIEEDQLARAKIVLQSCPHLRVGGLHIHLRSQVRDMRTLGQNYERVYALAERLAEDPGWTLEFINFGSGIALFADEVEADAALAQISRAGAALAARNQGSLQARLMIESGRFVVGAAGTYITEVVDIKESHGRKYLVVRGGLNGFLRPVLDQLLQGEPENHEPLYSAAFPYPMQLLSGASARERVTVVGTLCSGQDVLAADVELNQAKIGDLLTIGNAGAYGYTLSPLLFSGHEAPAQIWLDA
jgi:diaminopimelate decarboxylase